MAQKTSQPVKKTPSKAAASSRAKTTTSKSSSQKTGSQKAPPSKKNIQNKPSSSRGASRGPSPASSPQPVDRQAELNRILDWIGVGMVLVGLFTLFSLLSSRNSDFTGGVIRLLGQLFGWGAYAFPFGMLIGGGWLVLRHFERIPHFDLKRLIGFLLLYLNILVIFQFIAMAWYSDVTDPYALASQGKGGGYIGALLYSALTSILGVGGMLIALLAWFLIALAFTLDLSVLDLFQWVPRLIDNLKNWALGMRNKISRRVHAGSQTPYPELTPLPIQEENGSLPVAAQETSLQPPPFLSQTPVTHPAWVLPPLEDILEPGQEVNFDENVDIQHARLIEDTLASFGAPAHVVEINRGPTITQFGVEPDFVETRNGRTRVRVGKISALADDLALALSARTIRVQAPVPGKSFVGIEVPNEQIALVSLRDLMESEAFNRLKSSLRFALGLNVAGNAVAADLSSMPHLLIAGQTGSGKSVCVNALICGLLLHNTPDDLRLIMVDPKRVELTGYNGIPHLLAPVVVELEKVITVLQWVTREMDLRYRKLAEAGARNIQDYNTRAAANNQKKLPYLVVIIDELADLMMLAPDETERTITRLAQLARATGIHLVIATQRPSVDVVTGLIKANFPARIAFAVASGVDSRVILDGPGAERLLGRGDMLFQAPDSPAPVRLQGVFVSENEILRLVSYWQSFAGLAQPSPTAASGAPDSLLPGIPLKQMALWEMEEAESDADPLLAEAIDLSRRQGRASISMLQRRLRVGYTRAARLVETMEEKGIVGPPASGTGAREILDYGPAAPPIDEN